MTDSIHERISCLLDDELPPEEAERLLSQLRENPRLRACFHRYQAIAMALQNEPMPPVSDSFLEQLNDRIRQDSVAHLKPRRPGSRLSWSTGLIALAAAVLVWLTISGTPKPQMQLSVPTMASSQSVDPTLNRLQEYLQAHNSSRYVGNPVQLTANR